MKPVRVRPLRYLPALLPWAIAGNAYATAGGAGGGGGGGSSGGGGGGSDLVGLVLELLWDIIFHLPFPYNIITIAILVLIVWRFGGEVTGQVRASSGLNRIPSYQKPRPKAFNLPYAFLQRNRDFSQQLFLRKAETAFNGIQDAWMKQDLTAVRRWISDGVWQRFNTQFGMMRALGQTNTMSNLRIQKIFIDDIQQDGIYDIIDVGIHFTVNDNFVSARYPQLNQVGFLEAIEYWTFIRKSGVEEKDIYHSNHCPSCGALLPTNMGEIARCENCGTVSTLGDYDWVLSEITQADDYANDPIKLEKTGKLTQRIRKALGQATDFSVQLIEDKASNAYFQIMAAIAEQKPEKMRRFVDDGLFDRLTLAINQQVPFVFNRLYLNNVTLMDYFRQNNGDNLVLSFKYTAQRVDISDGNLRYIDLGLYANNEIMILSRNVGAGIAKGSLYAHTCPACGAPVGDTLDLKCSYCGSLLNSTQHEWIVTQILKTWEYETLIKQQDLERTTKVETQDLDLLFKVRDYAFNNLMMMIGIDGAITEEEMKFAYKLSKKLGYDENKVAAVFGLAQNRKLTLRMPEDRKRAIKVFRVMEKAAAADGNISAVEQALLDEMQQRTERMAA